MNIKWAVIHGVASLVSAVLGWTLLKIVGLDSWMTLVVLLSVYTVGEMTQFVEEYSIWGSRDAKRR